MVGTVIPLGYWRNNKILNLIVTVYYFQIPNDSSNISMEIRLQMYVVGQEELEASRTENNIKHETHAFSRVQFTRRFQIRKYVQYVCAFRGIEVTCSIYRPRGVQIST